MMLCVMPVPLGYEARILTVCGRQVVAARHRAGTEPPVVLEGGEWVALTSSSPPQPAERSSPPSAPACSPQDRS
jgi:hypothetical protein